MVKFRPGVAVISGAPDPNIFIANSHESLTIAVAGNSASPPQVGHLGPSGAVVRGTHGLGGVAKAGVLVLTIVTHSTAANNEVAWICSGRPGGSVIVGVVDETSVGTEGSEILTRMVRAHPGPGVAGGTGDGGEGPRGATVGGHVDSKVVHGDDKSVAGSVRGNGGVGSGSTFGSPGDSVVARHIHKAVGRSCGGELSRRIGGREVIDRGCGVVGSTSA